MLEPIEPSRLQLSLACFGLEANQGLPNRPILSSLNNQRSALKFRICSEQALSSLLIGATALFSFKLTANNAKTTVQEPLSYPTTFNTKISYLDNTDFTQKIQGVLNLFSFKGKSLML